MQLRNNTGTETGRDEIEPESTDLAAAQPFTPTEDWIQQYKKQCTPKLITGLNQFARTRVDGSLIPSRFDADVDRHVRRDVEERAVFIDRGDAHADRWTSASSSI